VTKSTGNSNEYRQNLENVQRENQNLRDKVGYLEEDNNKLNGNLEAIREENRKMGDTQQIVMTYSKERRQIKEQLHSILNDLETAESIRSNIHQPTYSGMGNSYTINRVQVKFYFDF
jgi:predicted nuclease with TOPRIM domain